MAIPQNIAPSYHKDYSANAFIWQRTRDCVAGEAVIKGKNTLYLPMPSAMLGVAGSSTPASVQNQQDNNKLGPLGSPIYNPNFHQNPAYAAYLSRAEFPEITQFILRGLLGLVGADKPTIKLPKRLEHLMESCTPDGLSLEEFYLFAVSEVLTTGRLPIFVDINPAGKPIFAPVVTESLINWKTVGGVSSGKSDAASTLVADFEYGPNDIFGNEPKKVMKLALIDETVYKVANYNDAGSFTNAVTPEYLGKKLNYIPMVCIGSITNTLSVDPSPLSPIAASSIHIYMKNADLSNAEFLTCNPTLVLCGVEATNKPTAIGSSVCWMLPDPEAKANYTTTDTSALSHVLNHITSIYEQAIYQGAQMLDSSKKAAEAAETTRLKQAASGATLLAVVLNVTEGFVKALNMMCDWVTADKEEVTFTPLTEFMSPTLSAAEQKALVESWMAGAISHPTLLESFRKAGFLRVGEDIDSEMALIVKEEAEREAKFLAKQEKLDANKSKEDKPTDTPTSTEPTPPTQK
jgi:hypothetical protein